jgi:predicted HTH transcriptional regulator
MLLGENTPLRNREMHLDWKPQQEAKREDEPVQSAENNVQSAIPLPPKCKNCTLEEVAVLRVIQQNPTATQKQIAQEIGKSERTVKTLTVRLTEQGIIVRKNGKRNGYWQIKQE